MGILTWIVVGLFAGVIVAAIVGAGAAREYDAVEVLREPFAAASRLTSRSLERAVPANKTPLNYAANHSRLAAAPTAQR